MVVWTIKVNVKKFCQNADIKYGTGRWLSLRSYEGCTVMDWVHNKTLV